MATDSAGKAVSRPRLTNSPASPPMDAPKKNVLWLTPGFAANESDRSCIPPLQALASALQESGAVSLHILALHYPFDDKPYHWRGIPVGPLGGRNRRYPARFALWARTWAQVYALHRTVGFDLIHSFWAEEAAFLAAHSARMLGLPHLCTLMGQDALPENRWLRWLRLGAFRTVAVSDFQAQVWQNTTGRPADLTVPWGLRETFFSENFFPEKNIDLLGVGALIPLKRYDWFLEVVEKLLPEKPNLRAVLIGSGPERERLEKMAEMRGLPVRFLGQVSREEVLKTMMQSKVLLHPSRYESYGYVLAEALAAGAHVVASPVGLAAGHPLIRTATDVAGLARQCALALAQKGAVSIEAGLLPTPTDTAQIYLREGYSFV